MKKTLYIISILTTLILISCSTDQPVESVVEQTTETNLVKLTPAQMQNANIETGKPERRNISATLQVNGVMEAPPQNIVSVSVPLGGYLKRIELMPGMHLKKGQLMAELEDQSFIELQQDYLTAKARLAYLEDEFARQRDLNQSKATSDKVYQQTLSEYKSQRVLLQALAEKLRLVNVNPNSLTEDKLTRTLRLYSPIDGYVTKINVNVGKYVVPTDVLFELVDPDDLHLMLTVFEKDLDKLDIGQKVVAYRANQPEKKYVAKVVYIGKDVNEDRAVEVHSHLQGEAPALVPGMFMNAEVEVQSRNAYTLPEDAFVHFGNKEYVFVVQKNGIFEMIEAETGNSEHGYTALLPSSGLAPEKQTFATKGAYTLLMKLKNKTQED